MPRWLRVLLVVCALVTTSGLPTIVAAATTLEVSADDCGDESQPCPDEGNGCPPFCHGCLCRVHYGTPVPRATVRALLDAPELLRLAPPAPSLQAPPPRGVFHPPRPSS